MQEEEEGVLLEQQQPEPRITGLVSALTTRNRSGTTENALLGGSGSGGVNRNNPGLHCD